MGLIMECVAHSMGWISEEEFMGFHRAADRLELGEDYN